MDHEGPNPKFNSQKRDNAAEQLTKLQEEYETHGKPSSDKMQPVLTHNEKYPKLREQLNRRQSDADVSDIDKARMHHAPRSKQRSGQTTRGKRDKNLTRVTKKRSRYCNCYNLSLSKVLSTKSCQFTNYINVTNKRIGTEGDRNDAQMEPMAVLKTVIELQPPKNDQPVGSMPAKNDQSVDSMPASIGSHITSVSSLNSYYSMDQEPMGRS